MKNKTAVLFILALFTALSALAQPTPTTPIDAEPIQNASQLVNSLFLLGISVVTPVLVRIGKLIVPKAPNWVLPIAAPVLVAVADWISSVAGGPSVSPMLALLLGAAGTGIREIKDQVGKKIGGTGTP